METNKDVLNQALQGFLSRLEKTEKFVLDQAPDVCKEMIREVVVAAQIQLTVAVLVAVLCIPMIPISIHNHLTDYRGEPTGWALLLSLGIIGIASGIWLAFDASYQLLYLKNCPKLFLLRQFKKLVK